MSLTLTLTTDATGAVEVTQHNNVAEADRYLTRVASRNGWLFHRHKDATGRWSGAFSVDNGYNTGPRAATYTLIKG